jgi:hypothetical protein
MILNIYFCVIFKSVYNWQSDKGFNMKKRYILGAIVLCVLILFFASVICGSNEKTEKFNVSVLPRIGQKLWTYNMNKQEWHQYKKYDDENSKEEIILQLTEPESNGGITVYNLLTGNAQVPKEPVLIGDNSIEFLKDKKLYSYFPKDFEYYQVMFNGVKFIPNKLSQEDISKIFKNYEIIKVSQLQNGKYYSKFSKKNNNYLILNDVGEKFYQYYIVPNDSKKLEIGEQSNTFKVNDKVDIKLQRLEGCTKTYPCFEISIN